MVKRPPEKSQKHQFTGQLLIGFLAAQPDKYLVSAPLKRPSQALSPRCRNLELGTVKT